MVKRKTRRTGAARMKAFRERNLDKRRAEKILGAFERLNKLLAEHPPGEVGSAWLLCVLSVPSEVLAAFHQIEREFKISVSDQCAQYIRAGYMATHEAIKIAALRGETPARQHDVQAAAMAVGEALSEPKGART